MPIVTIHQPNFLPNAAFFAKLMSADYFVYLDTAQFPTEGWVHRNKLLDRMEATWVTAPVITRARGVQRIDQVELTRDHKWKKKLLRRIEQEYSRAAFRDEIVGLMGEILLRPWEKLADLSIALCEWMLGALSISVPRERASELDRAGKTDPAAAAVGATERLVNLVKLYGGTTYTSGPSGKKYLDEALFAQAGIELRYFTFSAPPYPGKEGKMLGGLALLDMLLWLGPKQTRALLDGAL